MNIIKTDIPDVFIFEPEVFGDARGLFSENFNNKSFEAATGRKVEFVQDNHSQSKQGVLRGLHYQLAPHSQGKLVRCVEGRVFDVAVDIRNSSATFGQWISTILSAENKRQLWIPEGFAHGFMALSDSVQFLYKATNYYSPQSERNIRWDDSVLAIEWPKLSGCALSVSDKDLQAKNFVDAELYP